MSEKLLARYVRAVADLSQWSVEAAIVYHGPVNPPYPDVDKTPPLRIRRYLRRIACEVSARAEQTPCLQALQARLYGQAANFFSWPGLVWLGLGSEGHPRYAKDTDLVPLGCGGHVSLSSFFCDRKHVWMGRTYEDCGVGQRPSAVVPPFFYFSDEMSQYADIRDAGLRASADRILWSREALSRLMSSPAVPQNRLSLSSAMKAVLLDYRLVPAHAEQHGEMLLWLCGRETVEKVTHGLTILAGWFARVAIARLKVVEPYFPEAILQR